MDLRKQESSRLTEECDKFLGLLRPSAPLPLLILGLVIVCPDQFPDRLAIRLAPHRVRVLTAAEETPVEVVFERFDRQLRILGSRAFREPPSGRSAKDSPANANTPESEVSPYAQQPPWFDQKRYQRRLSQLKEPWRDEDAWKSET